MPHIIKKEYWVIREAGTFGFLRVLGSHYMWTLDPSNMTMFEEYDSAIKYAELFVKEQFVLNTVVLSITFER